MWPRSHTSGLMIGEWTRSSCSSLRWATSASVARRASSMSASIRPAWSGGEVVVRASAATADPGGTLDGSCVPTLEDGGLALIAEHTERPRREPQPATLGSGELDPAGAEDPQDVAVGEHGHGPLDAEDLRDHAVRPRADVLRPLAPGAAVAPQVPAGPLGVDLCGREALVVAVIPLEQVGPQLGRLAEATQLACFPRTSQRAAQHELEVPSLEGGLQFAGRLAAGVREGDVGAARVAPLAAPHGLGVAHQHDSPWRRGCVHCGCPEGAAASSTITLRRSRRSRLAGTWREGAPSMAATASALPAPVASTTQLRAASSTGRLNVIRSGGGFGESWTPRHSS